MLAKTNRPNRCALRYHGGKWRLAPWIISHFPPHITYVEAFGGGGSVLLSKPPARIEVYNDLNGLVVNFFRVLREQPQALVNAIELTPYSRAEFKAAQLPAGDETPLEMARRFYVWSQQGRGRAGVSEQGGWRFMSRPTRTRTPADDWNNVSHLNEIARRLKSVQIESDDALVLLGRYDTPRTLFYIDPPYLWHTRSERWASHAYVHEYTNEQHIALGAALKNLQGHVVVSGYPSELYADIYAGWTMHTKRATVDNARDGGKSVTEAIWLSPNITKNSRLF